jgi:hypothetical protein
MLHQLFYKKGRKSFDNLDDNTTKLFLNTLSNIVYKNVPVKPKLLQQMALYKCEIRRLVDPSESVSDKKLFLSKIKNQKGGIFPVFAALIPIISAIAPALAKAGLAIGTTAASAAIAKKIHDG